MGQGRITILPLKLCADLSDWLEDEKNPIWKPQIISKKGTTLHQGKLASLQPNATMEEVDFKRIRPWKKH